MTLTTDQIQAIFKEVMGGKRADVYGKEADKLRIDLQKDIEKAKKNGWTIEFPFEIPDFDEESVQQNEEQYKYYIEDEEESPYYSVYRMGINGKKQRWNFDEWKWIDEES